MVWDKRGGGAGPPSGGLWVSLFRGRSFPAGALAALLVFLFLDPAIPARAVAEEIRTDRMEDFFQGLVRSQMLAFHAPGAAVVMTRKGEMVFSRGWGWADPAGRTPFDPERSVCPAGSISKIFTDVALLQLHERGSLDLQADIRGYLGDFRLKTEYPQPITAANLMTHTSGFEMRVDGVMARTPGEVLPLERWVTENRRIQVRPPGVLTAYSNFDHTLAGLLVEKITGQAFADYAQENIFGPLGMASSSFRQPVPKNLAGRLVRGHKYEKGLLRPVPPSIFQILPAAGMSASPLDQARFMTALLRGGGTAGGRILEESSAGLMLRSQHDLKDRPGGLTYGFNEIFSNGQRVLYHGGLVSGIYSIMVLLPEEETGVLLIYNSESAFWGIYDLIPILVAYLFPDRQAEPPPRPQGSPGFDEFRGYYIPTSIRGSSYEPLLIALTRARLSATGQGTLLARWDFQSRPQEMVRVGDSSFLEVDGTSKLEFLENQKDGVQRFYFSSRPTVTFERMSWYETPPFIVLMVVFNGLVFLAAPVVWIAFLRPGRARAAGRALSLAGLAAVLGSLAYLIMGVAVADALRDVFKLTYGYGPLLRLGLKMPYLGAAATLLGLVLVVRAWRRGSGRVAVRVFFSLAVFSLSLFTLWLAYWWLF